MQFLCCYQPDGLLRNLLFDQLDQAISMRQLIHGVLVRVLDYGYVQYASFGRPGLEK
jgi:hypothetical protein